jgi:MFS family permease
LIAKETSRLNTSLTASQTRSFWAAWGGWTLDGMDSFIYALVLAPAMAELLPKSGIAATPANTGFYGSILFALFLVGWGISFIWGPIADRFGRVRTLMLTILFYSLFTFLGGIAANIRQLAIFRLLAGIGIGGEWTVGGTLVAEHWPESKRVQGGAYMHSGYYVGTLLAGLLNYVVGAHWGWRAMFLVGGTPALLIAFIRWGVAEPERWQTGAKLSATGAFLKLFSKQLRRRTISNGIFVLISMIGLWAGSVYVPTAVKQLALSAGRAAEAPYLASTATVLLSIGTIAGCLFTPWLMNRFGRRASLGFFFAVMAMFIYLGFGYSFYLQDDAIRWFMTCLFFLGVGGASFCVYTIWLPEQYPTECRASAFGFATSFGRFIAAGVTFLVGSGVSYFGTLGKPVALTAIAFVVGLLLLPMGQETKGQPLPD